MNRRLLLLFAIPFVGLTALDIATTYSSIHHRGFHEINIYTDTSSLGAMVVPEIVIFAACVAAVMLGAAWKGKELQHHADGGFSQFANSALRPQTVLGSLLIVAPIMLAIGRVFPVISNCLLLAVGWSPFDPVLNALAAMFRISKFRANGIMTGILFVFLVWPVLYLVFAAIRNAKQSDPSDSRQSYRG
jgi:hypothetical protein